VHFSTIATKLNVFCRSDVINSSLTKFDGGLLRLHDADEAAVDWLTTYGS